MSTIDKFFIGDSCISSVMYGELKIDQHEAIEYFKFANDAGGYFVHGLWIAPTNNGTQTYWWPWDLGVPSGALTDVNNGSRYWGYINDGSYKNITSDMNKTFPGNGWTKLGAAITFYSNTSNYTDDNGNACFDMGEFPITIEWKCDNLSDVTWIKAAGSIVDISEDNNTITIRRVGPSHIACYCSPGWDITTARIKFTNIYANVAGLTRTCLTWSRIAVGSDLLWSALLNSGTIYKKDKRIDNYLTKYGWCKHSTSSENCDIYKISKPDGLDVSYYYLDPVCDIADYIKQEFNTLTNTYDNKSLVIFNVKPDNKNFWNPVKDYFKNNAMYDYGWIFNYLPFQKSGIDELELHFLYNKLNDTWAIALDNFLSDSDCEKVSVYMDMEITCNSAVNMFRQAYKLKEIYFNKTITGGLFNGMFTFTQNLSTYPANLINWEGLEQLDSKYTVCTMGYFVEYSNIRVIPISSYNNTSLDRFSKYNTCIVNRSVSAQAFNGCRFLTYIGPVLDMRLVNPNNSKYFFGCDNLEDARICNLNNGNWIFDGSTVDGVSHGNLSKLNKESVQYMINNLYDLNSYNSDLQISNNNSFVNWQGHAANCGLFRILYNPDSSLPVGHVVNMCSVSVPIKVTISVFIYSSTESNSNILKFGDIIIDKEGTYELEKTDNTTTYLQYIHNEQIKSDINIYCQTNIDDAVSSVDTAYIKCPATWDSYITDDMIKQANNKNWTIYVGGQAKLIVQ